MARPRKYFTDEERKKAVALAHKRYDNSEKRHSQRNRLLSATMTPEAKIVASTFSTGPWSMTNTWKLKKPPIPCDLQVAGHCPYWHTKELHGTRHFMCGFQRSSNGDDFHQNENWSHPRAYLLPSADHPTISPMGFNYNQLLEVLDGWHYRNELDAWKRRWLVVDAANPTSFEESVRRSVERANFLLEEIDHVEKWLLPFVILNSDRDLLKPEQRWSLSLALATRWWRYHELGVLRQEIFIRIRLPRDRFVSLVVDGHVIWAQSAYQICNQSSELRSRIVSLARGEPVVCEVCNDGHLCQGGEHDESGRSEDDSSSQGSDGGFTGETDVSDL